MTSKTFADLDPEVFGPLLTRTEPIRTLDDMHDSELHEILQWAADNLPALHEADEHGHLGWYSDNELAQRRKADAGSGRDRDHHHHPVTSSSG